jgi:hypothetical protein
MTRRELNNFERAVLNAERGRGDGDGRSAVHLPARQARDLAEYVQWLERAVLVAAERADQIGDVRLQSDLSSVIA